MSGPRGTTVCPICGRGVPHHHPQDEIDEHRDRALASDAEIDAAALAVDVRMTKPQWRSALAAAFAVRQTVADQVSSPLVPMEEQINRVLAALATVKPAPPGYALAVTSIENLRPIITSALVGAPAALRHEPSESPEDVIASIVVGMTDHAVAAIVGLSGQIGATPSDSRAALESFLLNAYEAAPRDGYTPAARAVDFGSAPPENTT